MKYILLLAFLLTLTACATASPAPVGYQPMSPQEMQRQIDALTNTAQAAATARAVGTQDAQATVDAYRRDSTATVEALARDVVATVDLAHAGSTAAAAQVGPTQTAQTISLAATVSAQQDADLAQRRSISRIWSIVWQVATLVAAIGMCLAALMVGRAFEGRQQFEQIMDEDGKLIGIRFRGNSGGWVVQVLDRKMLAAPPVSVDDVMARHYWAEAARDMAQAASIAGSWSVNALSTREGGAGCASEADVIACQGIAEYLGAITNYGGTRGYDWSPGWDYPRLAGVLDGGSDFPLPLRKDKTIRSAPEVALPPSNTNQHKEGKAQIIQRSPTTKREKARGT